MGIIYPVIDTLIIAMRKLSLVELFKIIGEKIAKNHQEANKFRRIAIDIFIVLKWFVLLFFYFFNISNCLSIIVTTYLTFFNIFTYFYYHLWDEKEPNTYKEAKNGFVKSLFAFAFNIFAFAYFFKISNIIWIKFIVPNFNRLTPLFFSIKHTLGGGSELIQVVSTNGEILLLIHTITSFIFIVLIIANTKISILKSGDL